MGVVKTISQGLSPPVRGNPAIDSETMATQGPIPACAGEPPRSAFWMKASRAYPRLCGGTRRYLMMLWCQPGLSPPVRGNLRRRVWV